MMNIKELKKILSKNGVILNDEQITSVKTLMIRLSTIEYEYYHNKKTNLLLDCKVTKMSEIGSDIGFQDDLKIAS